MVNQVGRAQVRVQQHQQPAFLVHTKQGLQLGVGAPPNVCAEQAAAVKAQT